MTAPVTDDFGDFGVSVVQCFFFWGQYFGAPLLVVAIKVSQSAATLKLLPLKMQ